MSEHCPAWQRTRQPCQLWFGSWAHSSGSFLARRLPTREPLPACVQSTAPSPRRVFTLPASGLPHKDGLPGGWCAFLFNFSESSALELAAAWLSSPSIHHAQPCLPSPVRSFVLERRHLKPPLPAPVCIMTLEKLQNLQACFCPHNLQ